LGRKEGGEWFFFTSGTTERAEKAAIPLAGETGQEENGKGIKGMRETAGRSSLKSGGGREERRPTAPQASQRSWGGRSGPPNRSCLNQEEVEEMGGDSWEGRRKGKDSITFSREEKNRTLLFRSGKNQKRQKREKEKCPCCALLKKENNLSVFWSNCDETQKWARGRERKVGGGGKRKKRGGRKWKKSAFFSRIVLEKKGQGVCFSACGSATPDDQEANAKDGERKRRGVAQLPFLSPSRAKNGGSPSWIRARSRGP